MATYNIKLIDWLSYFLEVKSRVILNFATSTTRKDRGWCYREGLKFDTFDYKNDGNNLDFSQQNYGFEAYCLLEKNETINTLQITR